MPDLSMIQTAKMLVRGREGGRKGEERRRENVESGQEKDKGLEFRYIHFQLNVNISSITRFNSVLFKH